MTPPACAFYAAPGAALRVLNRGGGEDSVDDNYVARDLALPVTNRLGGDNAVTVPDAAPPLPKRGCGKVTVASDNSTTKPNLY